MSGKSSAKTALKVSGMMSEQGADNVGNKLSNAALVFAILIGTAAVIAALPWDKLLN